MQDFTPKTPPVNLRRYACPNCNCRLDRVKKEGCRSRYQQFREKCNSTGWGSLNKQEIEELK